MTGTSPTSAAHIAKCRFIFSFTSPVSDHERLGDFMKVSLSSACGIKESNIHIDGVECRMDQGKTIVAFYFAGQSSLDTWAMVSRTRKACADLSSPLNTVGNMKRVFNRAVFEANDPSAKSSRDASTVPKYHQTAHSDPNKLPGFPAPLVQNSIVAESPVVAAVAPRTTTASSHEIRSPKVALALPRKMRIDTSLEEQQIPRIAATVSWEASSPKEDKKSRGRSMQALSPTNRVEVPASPHIPINPAHYPLDVVMIPSGLKSPPESPKRELHVHLPPASFTEESPIMKVNFIDLKPIDELFSRPVPRIPLSLERSIEELSHALSCYILRCITYRKHT